MRKTHSTLFEIFFVPSVILGCVLVVKLGWPILRWILYWDTEAIVGDNAFSILLGLSVFLIALVGVGYMFLCPLLLLMRIDEYLMENSPEKVKKREAQAKAEENRKRYLAEREDYKEKEKEIMKEIYKDFDI